MFFNLHGENLARIKCIQKVVQDGTANNIAKTQARQKADDER